jgi:hypothetical protein
MSQVSQGVIVLLLYFEGVSRLMVSDLEAEKAVDSSKRLGVLSVHSQLRTALSILGLICDFAFQPLHGLHARRYRAKEAYIYGFPLVDSYRIQLLLRGPRQSRIQGALE